MKIYFDEIKPYNKLFFKSCYYNSLFAAVRYFDGDEQSIIKNNIPIYNVSKENYMTIEYKGIRDEKEVLMDSKILVNKVNIINDIVDAIRTNLIKGRLAIVGVDIYYLPNHSEAYMKKHKTHKLLVVGFDDKEHSFFVIDQRHIDTLSYQHCKILFEDLEKAFTYRKDSLTTVEKINYNDSCKILGENNYGYLVKSVIRERIVEYEKLLCISKKYIDLPQNIVNIEPIIKQINNIMHNKKNEGIICEQHKYHKEIIKHCNIAVDYWAIIRSKLLMASFEGKFEKKTYETIYVYLKKIKSEEEKFMNYFE